jgi:hypothetical protein
MLLVTDYLIINNNTSAKGYIYFKKLEVGAWGFSKNKKEKGGM